MKRIFSSILPAVVSAILVAPGCAAQDSSGELKHVTVPPQNGSRPVSLAALSIERGRYPGIIHLRGNVEIRTPLCVTVNGKSVCEGDTVLHADEATFHEDTGQIEAKGSVRVMPPQPKN